MKSRLVGKDPDDGKDWSQEEKGTAEDEMVGWHHWLDGHEFKQIQGDSEGQENLVCCSPWGQKESDTTYQLNNYNKTLTIIVLIQIINVVGWFNPQDIQQVFVVQSPRAVQGTVSDAKENQLSKELDTGNKSLICDKVKGNFSYEIVLKVKFSRHR